MVICRLSGASFIVGRAKGVGSLSAPGAGNNARLRDPKTEPNKQRRTTKSMSAEDGVWDGWFLSMAQRNRRKICENICCASFWQREWLGQAMLGKCRREFRG